MTTLTATEYPELKQYISNPDAVVSMTRVLDRLNNGEVLQAGRLFSEDRSTFCVLGLFYDESGDCDLYASPPRVNLKGMMEFYNCKTWFGSFDVNDLSENLINKIQTNTGLDMRTFSNEHQSSLYAVNDWLVDHRKELSVDVINQTLIDIILSGVIFQANTEED